MNKIIFGDCRHTMRDLIAQGVKVQMCVTSPPYFGLRDYGTAVWEGGDPDCDHVGKESRTVSGGAGKQYTNAGSNRVFSGNCACGAKRVDLQLGLEQTPDEYVAAMVEVFSLVWYLLADDGVLWLNLGDSYTGCANNGGKNSKTMQGTQAATGNNLPSKKGIGLKPKDLIGIPWRVAFALQAAGWYLRQDIIWHKPNPMPESVTDRCTKAHEYMFLLSKSERYYFDNEAIKEPLGTVGNAQSRGPKDTPGRGPRDGGNGGLSRMAAKMRAGEVETRNRRSVWTIATKPYKGAHFATFPPALIEPCILAGTSQEGHCPKCGKRWERIVKRTAENHIARQDRQVATGGAITGGVGKNFPDVRTESIGFFPSCTCGAAPVPDVVFDPFMGSGTTAQVSIKLGRQYLGCELNPAYADLQNDRTAQDAFVF